MADSLPRGTDNGAGYRGRMYESEPAWRDVDRYFIDQLVAEDEGLIRARASAHDAGWPLQEVAPNQGKFLALIAEMIGARRVLEFGTFTGYSTIWLARAVGMGGLVTTLDPDTVRRELEAYVDDGDRRQADGRRGREFALREYDWEVIAEEWRGLYASVM